MQLLFPLAFCPSIGYLRDLVKEKSIILEIHEHFLKQSIRSRCVICGPNGVLRISVPVVKPKGSKTPMSEVLVDWTSRWDVLFMRSLKTAYASSPYFEHYERDIQAVLDQKHPFLYQLNRRFLDLFITLWNLDITLKYSQEFKSLSDNDPRSSTFDSNIAKEYTQVFATEHGFIPHASALDALFCLGPMARNIIVGS